MAFIDSLSEEELQALEIVLNSLETIRDVNSKLTPKQKKAVNTVDSLFDRAPKAPKGLLFFRNYEDHEDIIGDGNFEELGFLVGAALEDPRDAVSFSFVINSEIPYIDLGDSYIFPRNLTVFFSRVMHRDASIPEATNRATATAGQLKKALVASMTILQSPPQRFHLIGQHDQSAHGEGGGGGGGGGGGALGASPAQKRRRKQQFIKNVKLAALIVAYVAYVYVSRNQRSRPSSRQRGESSSFHEEVRNRNSEWRQKEKSVRDEQITKTKAEWRQNRGL